MGTLTDAKRNMMWVEVKMPHDKGKAPYSYAREGEGGEEKVCLLGEEVLDSHGQRGDLKRP